MTFSIKIPAKCILAGEHVILERGFAVVSPYDYCHLTLSYKPGSMKTMYTISAEGYNSLGIILWPVVAKAYELLGLDVSTLTGEFDIQSSIPPGGGLGFSAALCVAVTEWLIYSDLIPRERLFDFAVELEHTFHFKSSGIDVAGVISKNIIQYTSNREITVINPSWKPKLFVSSSKEMAITGSCVQKVIEFRKANPERAKEIDDKMSLSTQLIKSALESPEHEGIPLLAQGLQLGNECFHEWELVSPQLAHHLDEVSQYAMACKVIGAGLGGHVVSLWEHNPPENYPSKCIHYLNRGELMLINDYMEQCRTRVNNALNEKLPSDPKHATKLQQAMSYAVLNGGKRLRSMFAYSVGELLNADIKVMTELCCAIEMIHAFSLVHDDLPALDNDDLRRGLPSCHKAFDEATAILAGDALHNMAFETICRIDQLSADQRVSILKYLADTTGASGLIGGEHLDLEFLTQKPDASQVEHMYALKTSCLISASIVTAAVAGGCQDPNTLHHLEQFGRFLGISFQIHDDIIGIESDTTVLGKKQNADLDLNKPIIPALIGLESAKIRRDELYDLALSHLQKADCCSEHLMALSKYIIERNY